MQISFLTCYNYSDTGRRQVQYELLKFWQNAIISSQIDFIYKAKVEFNEYSFTEYPDQTKLKNELNRSIISGYDSTTESNFWFVNKICYSSFKELYNDLAKTHRLMELTITVEE